MDYAAEYRIDVDPAGVTAMDIRTVLSKKLGLIGTQGLKTSGSGKEFPLGVAYDLLQVGAGLEGEAREEHIKDVGLHASLAITVSDIILSVVPISANAQDTSRYNSLVIKVKEQGAKSVTPDVVEELRAELAGTKLN